MKPPTPAPLVELMADHSNAPGGTETHVSVLLFAGSRAFKFCKPVKLDFLDYSTPQLRAAALRTELQCNRRFAPDVYLDVVELVGTQHEHGETDAPGEPVLIMRRMPEDRRFTRLLGTSEAGPLTMALARRIAVLHAEAPRPIGAAAAATRSAVGANWDKNHETLRHHAGVVLDEATVQAIGERFRRYLDGREALFNARITAGRAIDGHGDLQCEDIFCLPDGPRVLDCLAFDDRLRYGDVLLDAAFLAMDIERLGGVSLADEFLRWYGEFSGEAHPASLAHHYVAYRAQVRCKVACLRWSQGDPTAAAEAVDHLRRCQRHLDQGRVRLVLVGGAPGTGKTTVANGLGDRLGWAVLNSDTVRKELAGMAPTDRAITDVDQGLYDPASTMATYQELLRRAGMLLAMGEHVILDASWTDEAQRITARSLADERFADLIEIRLDTDPLAARTRIESRQLAGRGASDATAAVAEALRIRAAHWPEARLVRTDGPLDATIDAACQLVS
ncbi:MAG: AAA family ATPase [Acidimicrobiales bacterium]